jgi:nitronate monooxygenase
MEYYGYGWPETYVSRTIMNQTFVDHQDGKPFDDLKKLYDEAGKQGDEGWGLEGRRATYAGAAIGLIHEVKYAADIIHDIQQEAREMFTPIHVESSQKIHSS